MPNQASTPTSMPSTYLARSASVLAAVLIFLVFPHGGRAQEAKKALDHDAYDVWNRITERAISGDGTWVLYVFGSENGDATLRTKSLSAETEHDIPRGADATFTRDSRHVVFRITPPKKAGGQDEEDSEETPKDSLGVLDLQSGALTKIAGVKSFVMPEEAGEWVAYTLEPDSAAAVEAEENENETEQATLVLRNLSTGTVTTFERASAFVFSPDGHYLAYSSSDPDGVIAVETSTGKVDTLLSGPGVYKQLVFDEAGAQLAFLSNREDTDSSSLYLWNAGARTLDTLVTAASEGLPDRWQIGVEGTLSFSKAGSRLFFGAAPLSEPEEDKEAEEGEDDAEEDKVVLDVWNWKDPLLQPMQLSNLEQERKRTYRVVVHLDSGAIVALGNPELPSIQVGRNGEADFGLANTNVPYRKEISWDWPRHYDIVGVDVQDGMRRVLVEDVQTQASLSPDAQYIIWWDRTQLTWMALPATGGDPIPLTGGIARAFENETHDWPYLPNAYGIAGWTHEDKMVLIYDRHDIWAIDPTGKEPARNITDGLGAAEKIRFRVVRLDEDDEAIDPDEPLLLSAFDYDTKASGFYRGQVSGTDAPERLIMMDRRFSTPLKAKDADKLLFTREDFVEFSDLWVSVGDFDNMAQVSAVNPQQSEYRWGSAELVSWTSLDGIPLRGILYKPEGFDPAQQYPMIVYFYEKMSDGLHQHRPPAASRSSISFSFYVSRGYLVFVPDIPYRVGYPGESALHAVVPGVTALVDAGFVQEDNIGVQGHSWGGYQIAYMVTETNLFKAAEAGAPVSNMTSAYGGIRWASGMSRMFQYEKTQSRIGGSLWEYPLRYIDNSPLFQADKVETPVLMMHNDEDGAVPWYQGIEFFVALRRLGKPVWMLNYNGEAHGLRKYHNKRDFAIRMQQFFDHYLMGTPAPVWMEHGIPAVKKGKTLGLEPAGAQDR